MMQYLKNICCQVITMAFCLLVLGAGCTSTGLKGDCAFFDFNGNCLQSCENVDADGICMDEDEPVSEEPAVDAGDDQTAPPAVAIDEPVLECPTVEEDVPAPVESCENKLTTYIPSSAFIAAHVNTSDFLASVVGSHLTAQSGVQEFLSQVDEMLQYLGLASHQDVSKGSLYLSSKTNFVVLGFEFAPEMIAENFWETLNANFVVGATFIVGDDPDDPADTYSTVEVVSADSSEAGAFTFIMRDTASTSATNIACTLFGDLMLFCGLEDDITDVKGVKNGTVSSIKNDAGTSTAGEAMYSSCSMLHGFINIEFLGGDPADPESMAYWLNAMGFVSTEADPWVEVIGDATTTTNKSGETLGILKVSAAVYKNLAEGEWSVRNTLEVQDEIVSNLLDEWLSGS